jgi:hypothetical protein
MSWLFGIVPYVLALCSAALGVFALFKDWHNYKHPKMRQAVAIVVCTVAALSLIRQYKDDLDRRSERQKQAEATKRLEGEVQAANDAQRANTKLFLDSFGNLSQRVSDLQTQVRTDDLQKKLAHVQAELQATEKALAPAPRAHLLLSFATSPQAEDIIERPVTQVTLPATSDGIVHVEWTFFNPTDVTAKDGFVNFSVCDSCQIVSEPDGFRKLPGLYGTERNMSFTAMIARTVHSNISVDTKVPQGVQRFEIGMTYRCSTCITDPKTLRGIINVQRPFVKPFVVPHKK